MQMTRKRIRLLQLVHGYPPAVGGVEFSTRDLCEALVADYDLDVTVFTTNAFTVANFVDGSLPTIPINPAEEQNGVRIRRFPVVTHWAPVLRQLQRFAWHLKLPGNDRLRTWYHGPIAPDMLSAVREFEADVVCAASFPLNHMTYPFRRSEPRPPIVLVPAVHTTNEWGYLRPHLIELAARSFATVAHTEHEREWLIAHGAPAERVRVIGHGIELADFSPEPGRFRAARSIPPDALVVAYVGQQGGHKGIDTLLRVLPRLLERRPDAWLVVAGARTPSSWATGLRKRAWSTMESQGCWCRIAMSTACSRRSPSSPATKRCDFGLVGQGSAGSTSVTVTPASSRAITHSLWMPRGKAVYSPSVPNYPTEGGATQSARCGLKACHYDAGMACELRSVSSHDISSIASRGSGG
jgi:glycosyltransferase involved in cell wall biosynthesis